MGKLLIDTAKFDKKILAEKKIAVPAIVGWNRLEPRPRCAVDDLAAVAGWRI